LELNLQYSLYCALAVIILIMSYCFSDVLAKNCNNAFEFVEVFMQNIMHCSLDMAKNGIFDHITFLSAVCSDMLILSTFFKYFS